MSSRVPVKLLFVLATFVADATNLQALQDNVASIHAMYPSAHLVVVDNQSPIGLANVLDWDVFCVEYMLNTSPMYRYEAGAYRLALERYDPEILVAQQSNYIHLKPLDFDALLSSGVPVRPFAYFTGLRMGYLEGLTQKVLEVAAERAWKIPPECDDGNVISGVHSCSLVVCGRDWVHEFQRDLLSIPCDRKMMSVAFERLLGLWMYQYDMKAHEVSLVGSHEYSRIYPPPPSYDKSLYKLGGGQV